MIGLSPTWSPFPTAPPPLSGIAIFGKCVPVELVSVAFHLNSEKSKKAHPSLSRKRLVFSLSVWGFTTICSGQVSQKGPRVRCTDLRQVSTPALSTNALEKGLKDPRAPLLHQLNEERQIRMLNMILTKTVKWGQAARAC